MRKLLAPAREEPLAAASALRESGPAARRAAGLSRHLLWMFSGMDDTIEEEHEPLVRAGEDLEREHRDLHGRPDDGEAHAAHRDRLRRHIAGLQAYIERLRNRR